jgi:hypothetical protein
MTFLELEELMYDYESAKYSPSRSEVRLGCDCGCGGDSYTAESYDREEDAADAAIQKVREFCIRYGIEYDGIE